MSLINNLKDLSGEDTVQCFFFTPQLKNEISLDNLCKSINNSIKSLATEYLWHRDEFRVFVPLNEEHNTEFPHLASSTSFGDNIEDEWFIVYIILQLTKEYKDIVIQIKDNDGDFLLIEAADHLPSWANPETTENRVFIYNNHIHLIPTNVASDDETLSLTDAIKIIQNAPDQTQVSQEIEQAILNRVGNYPEKIKDNVHMAVAKIPLELAAVLKTRPNVIAPIVEAFCHHDVIDAKVCRNISYNNWITVQIKFTKCLYAMLMCSKLDNYHKRGIQDNKSSILGMKLTCGYAMIMNRSTDIYSSKEYVKFLTSLQKNGYFKNNLEGSNDYNKLLQNAKDFFSAVECPIASSVANDITQILNSNKYIETAESLKNIERSDLEEDSDDWLTIHPEQLNDLLNSRYGKKSKFKKGDILTPQNITKELNDFLKKTSDLEGIVTKDNEGQDTNIDFDSEQFVDCVEKMLKLLSSGNDNEEAESVDSDFSDDVLSQSEDDDELDKELKLKLHEKIESSNNKDTILNNMIKSMKEEKASVGPTSSLISSLGYNKTDFLDSDDDE